LNKCLRQQMFNQMKQRPSGERARLYYICVFDKQICLLWNSVYLLASNRCVNRGWAFVRSFINHEFWFYADTHAVVLFHWCIYESMLLSFVSRKTTMQISKPEKIMLFLINAIFDACVTWPPVNPPLKTS
jgi:hypothetical protein